MKKKNVFKIIAWIISSILVVIFSFFGYFYYLSNYKYLPSKNRFTERVAYINPEKSLLSEGFTTCDDNIVDYYNYRKGDSNGQVASYSKGKNGLRKHILSQYRNENYTDSGYLNIRFIINCKGEIGRFLIHENTLDLEPTVFSKDLKNQLFQLTTQLKKWNPVIFEGAEMDSYMYISYRIENGEITEIIP